MVWFRNSIEWLNAGYEEETTEQHGEKMNPVPLELNKGKIYHG